MNCAACVSNDHLRLSILSYLDCGDLTSAELVSKSWQTSALHTFAVLRQSLSYKLHAFKTSLVFNSDKSICSRIYQTRRKAVDSMLLIGGSFGSPHGEPWHIQAAGKAVGGIMKNNLYLPVDIGCTASLMDANGKLLLMGGWAEAEEDVLNTVYSLEMAPLISGGKFPPIWQVEEELPRPVCFPAAERTIRGDVVLIGGGDSPYRGGNAYAECLLRKYDENTWTEHSVPDLQFARCGHSALTTFDDSMLVCGGYAGGTSYLHSVELLSSNLDRWTTLPPMSVARSGMAAVLGPDGAVYVAGGSPDGTIGHKGLERYDLREGRWTPLREMQCGRGYATGCLAASDRFFVSGGLHNHKFQVGIEAYDFRTGLWTTQEVAQAPTFPELTQEVRELTKRRDEMLEYLQKVHETCSPSRELMDTVFKGAVNKLKTFNEQLTVRAVELHRCREAARQQLSPDSLKRACHVMVGIM